ncbi:rhythmically expressed gene 5 protein [Neodiprion virginianus]|uniref:rhythmically expressed gene 5 protein n=1 Tax=Neodiprion virginianus TaxID=2961670 RepID=UPI001EE73E91|nr:rhythmically expressed gene 5 protein [Neodiprion virginianus]
MIRCSIISAAVVLCLAVAYSEGSAIPMWEFLSKEEKMSHLYKVFSKQVAKYCADSSKPDCNKNLLVSGLRNLANMDEDYLNTMDPYQRGATEMIWHALLTNDDFESTFEREGDSLYYSSESDRFGDNFGSDNNGLAEESSAPSGDYVRPAGHTGPYLMGPMVIRVLPDGRPVPGDSELPLPRDEDVDDLKYAKLPSIAEIESRSFFFGKSLTSSGKPAKRPIFSVGQQKPSVILTTRRSGNQQKNPLFDDRVRGEKDIFDSYERSVRYY